MGALFATSVALGAGSAGAAGRPAVPDEPQPTAFIVVDADTGAIIATRNEHQALPASSTVKLVTALVGLERLPLESSLDVSRLDTEQPSVTIDMQEGQKWPMTDAIHALLMASANDAAYAIAENASGTVPKFTTDMQNAARRWGLVDSTLDDPAGLDAQGNGGSIMSAYDLAVVGRNALAVPVIADAAGVGQYPFTDPTGSARVLANQNDSWLSGYEGADGLKPDLTDDSKRALVASATRDGRTCVAVVLGIYDVVGWAAKLTDQCFATPVAQEKTAASLPPVRVATVDARRDAVAGFPRALGAPALGRSVAARRSNRSEVAGKRVERAAATNRATTGDTKAATTATTATAQSSGGSLFTLRNVLFLALALLVIFVLLRRRAVKRTRQRRAARQRMLADARRRGVLQVIDPESTGEVSHVSVVPRNGRPSRRSPR